MAPVNMQRAGAKVLVTISGVGTAKSRKIMNLRDELAARGESLSKTVLESSHLLADNEWQVLFDRSIICFEDGSTPFGTRSRVDPAPLSMSDILAAIKN